MAKTTQYVATLLLVLCTLANAQNTTKPETTVPPKTTPEPPKTTDAPTTEAPTVPPTEKPTTAPPTEKPTTAAPTTAPTPTPAPANKYYNITESNVTCIMIDGDFSFLVSLDTNDTKKVVIPKHDATATGTCNGTDGAQSITLTWGKNSATLDFKMTKNMWNISSYTAELVLDGSDFKNATVFGKNMSLDIDLVLNPVEVAVNHSYKCMSHLDSSAQATLNGKEYKYKVVADMDGMWIQAFNMIPNEPDFVDATRCNADETSDIVPIAVGCALAGLVIVVLIAYLVGRRRRSAAYQSV